MALRWNTKVLTALLHNELSKVLCAIMKHKTIVGMTNDVEDLQSSTHARSLTVAETCVLTCIQQLI